MTNEQINQEVARRLGADERNPHNYCEKIAAAWEIVEFMKDMAFEIHTTNPGYLAMFTGPTWKQMVESRADTAPMAICLAFLKLEGK